LTIFVPAVSAEKEGSGKTSPRVPVTGGLSVAAAVRYELQHGPNRRLLTATKPDVAEALRQRVGRDELSIWRRDLPLHEGLAALLPLER
jgi:hypothetical protein